MPCQEVLVLTLSWAMVFSGLAHFGCFLRGHAPYGRYVVVSAGSWMVPAKMAWFIQELPALLVPLLLLLTFNSSLRMGGYLLLLTFCLHYFQRTCVYSTLTRGRPYPMRIMATALLFTAANGFLQAHYLLHCATFENIWSTHGRIVAGLIIFFTGMVINIHSDCILRNLRRPGEISYSIPRGGLFEYVSGANYFGEIVEWWGYAIATWSLPAVSFALFSTCFIGPRAYHHHRFYLERFKDYPKHRKPLIPLIL